VACVFDLKDMLFSADRFFSGSRNACARLSASALFIKGWVMALAAAMRRFFRKVTSRVPTRTLRMSGLD
jgi:hypothetical protein